MKFNEKKEKKVRKKTKFYIRNAVLRIAQQYKNKIDNKFVFTCITQEWTSIWANTGTHSFRFRRFFSASPFFFIRAFFTFFQLCKENGNQERGTKRERKKFIFIWKNGDNKIFSFSFLSLFALELSPCTNYISTYTPMHTE